MRAAAPACVVAAALACGCSSQWYAGAEHSDIARTDVVIRTEPTGAKLVMTRFNSADSTTPLEVKELPGHSPVNQPIEYDHTDTLYERQSNYGAHMREDMSTVVQILTFPVWAVASFFHYRDEKHRHQYGNNAFTVSAHLPGRENAEVKVVLEGEAEHPVLLLLPPELK